VRAPLRLHPDTVRQLATAIAEELRAGLPAADKPLTVAEVARMLGCSAGFVRDHRRELGVLPATGSRPRLRFDPERVGAYMRAPTLEPTKRTVEAKRRRQSNTAALLPIRGMDSRHAA
jgi:hypothetical protein